MTIESDVQAVAKQFGVDPALLQAIVQAEGGGDHIITAVRCSLPSVTTRAQALDVTARSIVHALSDYVKQTNPGGFVWFMQQRWAPNGAANDPTGLNGNWSRNVSSLWGTATPSATKV